MLLSEDSGSVFIHPFMNTRLFNLSVSGVFSFMLYFAKICMEQLFANLPDFTSFILPFFFTYKCTWILTSVFKSTILLSYSVPGVTQKALKRLNRFEQEPDTVPVILCQCCFDIVWMLVEPNRLGLIEKLINRQGETKKKPMLAVFVPTLNSALIWNVPAVHCTQKNCCLSQTWSWHLRWVKRDWGSAGPRPLGYDWGPLGRSWWTGVEGSIATGWHTHWALYGSEKKLGVLFSVCASVCIRRSVCVCMCTHAPAFVCRISEWGI